MAATCFDICKYGDKLIDKFLSKEGNLIIIRDSDRKVFCFKNEYIIGILKDRLDSFYYECAREDNMSSAILEHPYAKVPFHTDIGDNIFVPAADLEAVINSTSQIFHMTPEIRDNKHYWINFTVDRRNALSINPDYVSASHCQDRSSKPIYRIRECTGVCLTDIERSYKTRVKKRDEVVIDDDEELRLDNIRADNVARELELELDDIIIDSDDVEFILGPGMEDIDSIERRDFLILNAFVHGNVSFLERSINDGTFTKDEAIRLGAVYEGLNHEDVLILLHDRLEIEKEDLPYLLSYLAINPDIRGEQLENIRDIFGFNADDFKENGMYTSLRSAVNEVGEEQLNLFVTIFNIPPTDVANMKLILKIDEFVQHLIEQREEDVIVPLFLTIPTLEELTSPEGKLFDLIVNFNENEAFDLDEDTNITRQFLTTLRDTYHIPASYMAQSILDYETNCDSIEDPTRSALCHYRLTDIKNYIISVWQL